MSELCIFHCPAGGVDGLDVEGGRERAGEREREGERERSSRHVGANCNYT